MILFLSLDDFESTPVEPIDAVIQHLAPLIGSFNKEVNIAKEWASQCSNEQLTIDESASIYLYTMGPTTTDSQPFYGYLNEALRSKVNDEQKVYFPYLKLFISALSKLEPVALSVTRGTKMDLSETYSVGKTFFWSTFRYIVFSVFVLFRMKISFSLTVHVLQMVSLFLLIQNLELYFEFIL